MSPGLGVLIMLERHGLGGIDHYLRREAPEVLKGMFMPGQHFL
jgi:hypothetical protein